MPELILLLSLVFFPLTSYYHYLQGYKRTARYLIVCLLLIVAGIILWIL